MKHHQLILTVLLLTFLDCNAEIPKKVENVIRGFFKEIIARDATNIDKFFIDEAQFKEVDLTAEGKTARQFNYRYARGEFVKDCTELMQNLPLVGSELSILKLSVLPGEQAHKDPNYHCGVRVYCRYGKEGGRLDFVTPPLILVGDKWKFSARFEKLMRFANIKGLGIE